MVRKIGESFYRPVSDPLKMPAELNKLEDELIKEGYTVKPRKGPVVIIELDDGEIHYLPGNEGIWQYVFKREVCC